MDKRSQLIEALIQLSHNCNRVAQLLESAQIFTPPDEIVQINKQLYVTVEELTALTPISSYSSPAPPIKSGNKILEVTLNESSLKTSAIINSLHILYLDAPKEPTIMWDNIKIVARIDKIDDDYDIIFINESLEFIPNPINFLIKIKSHLGQNGKVAIRFRPWSASHGGFQALANVYTPYAHILSETYPQLGIKPIVNKAVRPLQTYSSYIAKSGLSIVSNQIHRHNVPIPTKIFGHIISNLWGDIIKEDAYKILAIHNVDYLLCR